MRNGRQQAFNNINKAKERENMKEVTGNCRFCGQAQILKVPDTFTEADIEEEVTRKCDCEKATHYIKVEERIAGAEEAIRTIFKELPEMEDVKKHLLSATRLVAENKFNKITISKGKYTASMKPGKKAIKISVKFTDERTEEV